jgi:monofunctional biosynthetic peptidoglycan transglycosylase
VAKKTTKRSKQTKSISQRLRRYLVYFSVAILALIGAVILVYRFVPVWATPYMISERQIIGDVAYEWVSASDMSPDIFTAAVAAEDANFCLHWGFDMRAIRGAIADGGTRGASTITQQVAKNTFLWHGRSWVRKAIEAILTPTLEIAWSKRRILEVYVNIAEFDTGVFGVEAAANHYFGIGADAVSPYEAALLMAVLPDPKNRSARDPSDSVRARAMSIMDGSALIRKDGRSSCFLD